MPFCQDNNLFQYSNIYCLIYRKLYLRTQTTNENTNLKSVCRNADRGCVRASSNIFRSSMFLFTFDEVRFERFLTFLTILTT